jgi:hypothetical protein
MKMKIENVHVKTKEERKAAENAKAILGRLTPSNAHTDRIIFVLRYAANLAASAALIRLESKKDLNAIRNEAARSLNAACGLLDKRRLTQDAIDEANRAVEGWLDALPVGRRPATS